MTCNWSYYFSPPEIITTGLQSLTSAIDKKAFSEWIPLFYFRHQETISSYHPFLFFSSSLMSAKKEFLGEFLFSWWWWCLSCETFIQSTLIIIIISHRNHRQNFSPQNFSRDDSWVRFPHFLLFSSLQHHQQEHHFPFHFNETFPFSYNNCSWVTVRVIVASVFQCTLGWYSLKCVTSRCGLERERGRDTSCYENTAASIE